MSSHSKPRRDMQQLSLEFVKQISEYGSRADPGFWIRGPLKGGGPGGPWRSGKGVPDPQESCRNTPLNILLCLKHKHYINCLSQFLLI